MKTATMKTAGEIEAAVCAGISRFEQDYLGRGPKDIRTHLLGDGLWSSPTGHAPKPRGQSQPPRSRRDFRYCRHDQPLSGVVMPISPFAVRGQHHARGSRHRSFSFWPLSAARFPPSSYGFRRSAHRYNRSSHRYNRSFLGFLRSRQMCNDRGQFPFARSNLRALVRKLRFHARSLRLHVGKMPVNKPILPA